MSEIIQGVFEFVPPFQGYVIYLDHRFLVMMGTSDNTMFCTGGKYEISGDTITDIKLFSTNPNEVGNTQPWIAEMLHRDTLKATLFIKDGSTMMIVKMVRKVNPTDEMRSQMKGFEGFYQYVPPPMGLSTMLGGYYIYLAGQSKDSMDAIAGTYEYQNDTITCIRQFAMNPQMKGAKLRWISESVKGDTLIHAVINEDDEVVSRGPSVRPAM